ncbi:hypothetical protein [Pseudomonas sp. SCB32]|uniref:hypothetical protein n=1 Tax=Pseudomonas sp. SCB32 TaxID=2653853 RepID=UPI001265A7A9|nr:hypothetical protein [Pseudomonas sp. SCB32]
MTYQVRYLALAGILAAFFLNVVARGLLRIGNVPATLLVAALIAASMALWFARRHKRLAQTGERWRLTALYGGGLAVLYLALVGLAAWKNTPSPAGLLLYGLNYLCYPLSLWWFFRPGVLVRFLPKDAR